MASSSEAKAHKRSVCAQIENDFEIVDWEDSVGSGYYVLEALDSVCQRVDCAIVILSPDDQTLSRGVTKEAPRDNLIFEAGFFIASLGRENVAIFHLDDSKLPSDMLGLSCVQLSKNNKYKSEEEIAKWVHHMKALKGIEEKLPITVPITTVMTKKSSVENQKPALVKSLRNSDHIKREKQATVKSQVMAPENCSKFLVTQNLFIEVMGFDHSHFKGEGLPADSMSWLEALNFCNRLSERHGYEQLYDLSDKQRVVFNDKGRGFAIPTEDEWDRLYVGEFAPVTDYAWCSYNSQHRTHPVGQLTASENGYFDLLGNVWEWCFSDFKKVKPGNDQAPNNLTLNISSKKVIKGGFFGSSPNDLKPTLRSGAFPTIGENSIGFRIILRNTN